MKKFVCLLLSFLILVCAAACSSHTDTDSPNTNLPDSGTSEHPDDPEQLDTPIVSYENGIISWVAVDNADKYEIEINGKIEITYNTKYSLPVTSDPVKYDIRIKAISENPSYLNSPFSALLSFETYKLPPVSIDNISYDSTRSKASITLSDIGSEKVQIFLNDDFYSETSTSYFELSNQDVQIEYNTLSFIAVSDSPYILDSEPSFFYVYKNKDYDDIKLEDGKLMCRESPNSSYEEYNTATLNPGKQTALITHFDYISFDQPNAQIILCSDGVPMDLYKIAPANILSCSYSCPYNSNIHSIQLTLKNFANNPETDNRYLLGYDYETIEFLIPIDSYGNKRSFTYDIAALTSYTECTLSFYSYLTSTPSSITIILHKDGYISSTPVSYEFY